MTKFIADPEWEAGRPVRVLVEAAEWQHREALLQTLRGAGYATAGCPGPEGTDTRCPFAAGEPCRAAEEADVIVHTLRASDPRNQEVLSSLARRTPDTPVIVEVPGPVVLRHPDAYAKVTVVESPMDQTTLLETVAALVG